MHNAVISCHVLSLGNLFNVLDNEFHLVVNQARERREGKISNDVRSGHKRVGRKSPIVLALENKDVLCNDNYFKKYGQVKIEKEEKGEYINTMEYSKLDYTKCKSKGIAKAFISTRSLSLACPNKIFSETL